MAEEFLESDVVFSDHHHHHHHNPPCAVVGDGCFDDYRELVEPPPQQHNSGAVLCGKSMKGQRSSKKVVANSMPVSIPERMLRCWDSGDEVEDEEGMEPPHVIVGRRIAGKMAFSVCTGNGRTLKGRDLSQVRNSILRMTGFLEA